MEKQYILIVDKHISSVSRTAHTIVGMRLKSVELSIHTLVQKAINIMKLQKFALIITNVELLEMSGFELIEEARKLGQDCPVIFQTTIVDKNTLHKAKEIDAFCISTIGKVDKLTDPIRKCLNLDN